MQISIENEFPLVRSLLAEGFGPRRPGSRLNSLGDGRPPPPPGGGDLLFLSHGETSTQPVLDLFPEHKQASVSHKCKAAGEANEKISLVCERRGASLKDEQENT